MATLPFAEDANANIRPIGIESLAWFRSERERVPTSSKSYRFDAGMSRNNRFVFVAGLHRSGTSLLARILAGHPEISAIEGAPVPENEGCYLQGAIPHTARHGRPGHYATDPAQHHTESSPFNTLEVKTRMIADWAPWFDHGRPWWLEKSPVNLNRTRLYQQLFPTCQFIVILRHPQLVAAAMAKWVDADARSLLAYVLDAYDLFAGDLPYLHAAMVVRYEDLIESPDAVRGGAFAFLGLEDSASSISVRDGNADYTAETGLDGDSVRRLETWGYRPGGRHVGWTPIVAHTLRSIRDAVGEYLSAEPVVR